jgi:hypothetical protein
MKKILFVMLSFLSTQAVCAQETDRLTDDLVPFVYESRTAIPTSDEKLAGYLSDEYLRAPDEFTKHDMLEKIKPVIKSKLDEAKSKKEYFLRVGTTLGQYDFDKKQFPSGLSSSTFIPFDNYSYVLDGHYAVVFDNAKEIENIPLSLDAAKSLSGKLQQSRDITAVIYCRVLSAQEKKLNYRNFKVINTHVTKVEFLAGDGELISTVTPAK